MKIISDKLCGENQNVHFMFDNVLWKSCPLCYSVAKYCRFGDVTHNIILRMRFACRITKATNTLIMCNTYFFSMATKATRTLLVITLYTHCLSCSLFETHQHLGRHVTWRHEVLGKNPIHRNNEINEASPSLSSQLFVSAWNLTKLNKQGKCSQELVLAHNKALLGLTPRRMSNSCFHLRRSLEPSPILFIVRMEQWGKLQKQNCYLAAAKVGCFIKSLLSISTDM
jgi:hypothetical protein